MWKLNRLLFCVFILFALQAGLTNAATLLVTDNASTEIEISNDIDWFPIVNQSYSISATYLNTSSGLPLTPPTSYCQVNFNGTEINLTYNATSEAYAEDFTFEQSGDYSLSVLCNTSAIGEYEVFASNYTNITIWDELLMQFVNQTRLGLTDYLIPNLDFVLGVNLTNLSGVQNATVSPAIVSDASCSAQGVGTMSFNGSLYLANTSESSSGVYSYNVSCDVGSVQLNLTSLNITVDDYHAEFVDSGQEFGGKLPIGTPILLAPDYEINPLIAFTDFYTLKIWNLSSRVAISSNSTGNYYNGVLGFYDHLSDGDFDVFYTGAVFSGAKIIQNEEYSFTSLLGLSVIDGYSGVRLSLFDQNMDGHDDAIVSSFSSNPTIQLTNNGSGFENQILFSNNWESTQCYFDANNDTAYDLYYAGDNGTTFAGIYHNNNGTFTALHALCMTVACLKRMNR